MAANSDQLALFNQYDNEYCSKSTDVANSIQKISALSGEQRRAKVREVEAELREADRIVKRMEMEARSFAPTVSNKLIGKVRDYKADVAKLQEEVRIASSAASGGAAARAELGLGDDFYATSSGQRERMLQSTEKLARTGDRINQGKQQLLETEGTGASILEALHRQRETIQRSQAAQRDVDSNVQQSQRALNSMSSWWPWSR